MSSDDAGIGWISGRRVGEGALLAHLAGSELCAFVGMAGGTMVQYPELLVLGCEALEQAEETLQMMEFDEADLALDVIREVGPRGHYLKQRHTREHMRAHRLPAWARLHGPVPEDGSLAELATHASRGLHPDAARTAAREEYRRLEHDHHPAPLPADVRRELDDLLAAADNEARNLL